MAVQHRHDRLMTIQELLDTQHEITPLRCARCGREEGDRDHELLQAALRARIRTLEAKVFELEAEIAART